jgi:hypothetical protein
VLKRQQEMEERSTSFPVGKMNVRGHGNIGVQTETMLGITKVNVPKSFVKACSRGDVKTACRAFTKPSLMCSSLNWAMMVVKHAIETHNTEVAIWVCEAHPAMQKHRGNTQLAYRLCQYAMQSDNVSIATYFWSNRWFSHNAAHWGDHVRCALIERHYFFLNWAFANVQVVRDAIQSMAGWAYQAVTHAVLSADADGAKWLMIRSNRADTAFHLHLLQLMEFVQSKVDENKDAMVPAYRRIEAMMALWIERIAAKRGVRWDAGVWGVRNRTGRNNVWA